MDRLVFSILLTGLLATITLAGCAGASAIAPTIVAQPTGQTVIVEQAATFSVVAVGTRPVRYQWSKNGVPISGATSSSYTTPATSSSDDGAQFAVVASNRAGSVTSNPATLTVNVPPSITAHPSNQTVAVVQTASFSVAATGTSPLSYQWRKNGTPISGATTATFTTPTTTTFDDGAQFTVVVSNSAGSVTSDPATLTVNVPPAFPGAQGGGARSVGGRGGAVYLVSNTNDSGPGSLRECVEASGPRTCIFRTGGTIALLSSLTISNPFITIAGQAAPGDGIQIAGPSLVGSHALLITTHDVVVRYLRIRRGHNPGETCSSTCGTNVLVLSNTPGHDPYNILLDHISSEWSNNEALVLVGGETATVYPRLLTVSYSILGESLAAAGQTTLVAGSGFSGQGSRAPDGMTDIDFHHNLFAGASHRMPLLTVNSGRLVNNFVYAWTHYPMRSKGSRDFINNYFQLPAGQPAPSHEIQAWTEDAGNDTSLVPSFYVAGNAGPSDPGGISNWMMTGLAENQSAGEASSPLPLAFQRGSPIPTPVNYIPISSDPVTSISSASGVILNTARAAPYDGVGASRKLSCTGAWEDARDSVDTRIANAVASGTPLFGSFTYVNLASSPQTQDDLGGWPTFAPGVPCTDSNNNGLPDVWESYWAGVLGLGSTLDPNGFSFGDEYTNLEHYINGLNPSL
jgi:pectate lyase